jgi:hypothetical protein
MASRAALIGAVVSVAFVGAAAASNAGSVRGAADSAAAAAADAALEAAGIRRVAPAPRAAQTLVPRWMREHHDARNSRRADFDGPADTNGTCLVPLATLQDNTT